MPSVLNKHHGKIPPDAVYVGRGSRWGNPYSHLPTSKARFKVATREEAIAMFAEHVLPRLDVTALRGKDLVCFCAPKACHADLLLKKANE